MPSPPTLDGEARIEREDIGLWIRLLLLDFVTLTLQASVMSHLQTSLTRCNLVLLVVIFVGFRQSILIGAAHSFLLGWASGALMAEPTGIPLLVIFLLGLMASVVRHNFQIELLWIRVLLAIIFVGSAALLTLVLTLALWQRLPPIQPLSLLIYALLAPAVDFMVGWFLARG